MTGFTNPSINHAGINTQSIHISSPSINSSTPIDEARQTPLLTVIVPTRNEADNVAVLVSALEKVLAHVAFEIIFVDDSDDSTPQVVEDVATRAHCTVSLCHRPRGEREGGLGGAVLLGVQEARSHWICVMDGDLQHPPAIVPQLLEKAQANNADLVVGSRYRDDGNARGLNFLRFGISQSFDTAARLIFPKKLQNVSDPMSGLFLVRKSVLDLNVLQPHGFKILLEILIRTPDLRVAEVPFEFGVRHTGESKANFREGLRYLTHIMQLFIGEDLLRFVRFCLVGASGIFVNLLMNYLATDGLGLHYLAGAIVATQGSSLWNFVLTEAWVFKGRQPRWNRLYRLVMFMLMNNSALVLRGPIIFTMTAAFGIHYLWSNLFSILALTLVRYALADVWIWKKPQTQIETTVPSAHLSHSA